MFLITTFFYYFMLPATKDQYFVVKLQNAISSQ